MPANPFHKLLVGTMPLMPRALIWRFSNRYIAGTHLDDAYRAVHELNDVGCTGTIDVLGEDITNQEQVNAALQLYREALDGIYQDTVREHPVVEGLSQAVRRYGLDRAPFETLLDARAADLDDTPPADLAALEN